MPDRAARGRGDRTGRRKVGPEQVVAPFLGAAGVATLVAAEVRDRRVEVALKVLLSPRKVEAKVGSDERCPCGSGLKYKHYERHLEPRPSLLPMVFSSG